jgi:hypothetical protein
MRYGGSKNYGTGWFASRPDDESYLSTELRIDTGIEVWRRPKPHQFSTQRIEVLSAPGIDTFNLGCRKQILLPLCAVSLTISPQVAHHSNSPPSTKNGAGR